MVRILAAGLIAGAIGAGIWAAVSYFTGYEIGWIAWGVGGLVGLAVGAVAGNAVGTTTSLIAALIAVAAVLGGKFSAHHLMIQQAFSPAEVSTEPMSEEFAISLLADELVVTWEEEGRPLNYPADADLDFPEAEKDYPPDVWAEAERWWATFDEQQKADFRKVEPLDADAQMDLSVQTFKHAFSPWDGLWLLLAVATAWTLGGGGSSDD